MCISAFQTHSEVGVGEEWGGGSRGSVEFLGFFLSCLVKGEG